jgi:hypothetical protein
MCVLSLDVIIDIINKQSISNNGFESMHVIDEIQNLSLLFDMCVNSQFPINRVFFYYDYFSKRFPKKSFYELTSYNVLQDNVANITLNLSSFPFLFSHGHGSYDGKISIHECLKFHMNTLFSPFTLLKPYFLIMYDL